jgi:plastocyanin
VEHRRHRLRRLAAVVAIGAVGAVGLSACSSESPSGAPAADHPSGAGASRHDTVVIKNFAFDPGHLTVTPGATITVTNDDPVIHTFTADGGAFNTGNIGPGQTKTVVAPKKAGEYPFRCQIHQFMTGTLTVT